MEADIQAWARLLRAQKLVLERVETALKAAGLPPLAWYDVLLELDRDDSRDGLRQYQIAERILLTKHNLTRLLDRLEHNGLVERRGCPEDGRGNIVTITRKGTTLRREMWPVYAGAVREHFTGRLTATDVESLSRILRKLVE
jgi:DNA-binding MarR family transcriptional regulator